MTNILKAVVAAPLVCVVASMLIVGSAFGQISDVPGWKLVWHDEFDGDNIDTDKWEPLYRQDSFNNERQFYLPEQVTVADGNLRITATNQPIENKQYRSGLITSKELFGPGRYEARIDLPTTKGMWPAFWMNANQTQWPTAGEIDILENRGHQPDLVSSAYHWQVDPNAPCCGQHQYTFAEYTDDDQPVDFHSGFHTYAVEWDHNLLRFYVDGNLYHTIIETAQRPIFEVAKNIILNLAVGGDFLGDQQPDGSTVFPQTMLVDYVRVWNRQTGLQGDYNGDGVIDAADYTVWRNSSGQQGIGLPADGSGNGSVGPEDYDVWKTNYAEPLNEGAGGTSHAAPEPTSAVPMAIGCLFLYAHRAWLAPINARIG